MSVLKNNRKISNQEYEHTFGLLYQFSATNTMKISKRRKRWMCSEIEERMNDLFDSVVGIDTDYDPNESRKQHSEKLAIESISKLLALQKPLLVMWNVCNTSTNTMAQWASLINSEISLLERLTNTNGDNERMFIIDYRYVEKAEYVRKMSELHRYVHSKIVHAPLKYSDTHSSLIIHLIDDALYNTMKANVKIPETKAEYVNRRKHISAALSDLYKLQRPLTVFFSILEYSENVIQEWSKMLDEEIRLLNAINKSDSKRFSNLV